MAGIADLPHDAVLKEYPVLAHRIQPHDKLWISDADLIRWLGLPEKKGRQVLRQLDQDRRSGFPQKKPFWNNQRYVPAIKEYLDRTNGLIINASTRERRHADVR